MADPWAPSPLKYPWWDFFLIEQQCGMSTSMLRTVVSQKASIQQGVIFMTWFKGNTQESPGLTLITDSELTMSSGGTQPGKEDPSQTCREGKGIGWLSADPPELYTPPYRWTDWETVEWVAWHSSYPKKWKEQPLSEVLVWATDHH